MIRRFVVQALSISVLTAAMLLWVVWDYFIFDGTLILSSDVEFDSSAVKRFGTKDQLVELENGLREVASGSRIPFLLNPPRPFSAMTLRLWGPNISSQREVLATVDSETKTVSRLMYTGDARLAKLDNHEAISDRADAPETWRWASITNGAITVWQRETAAQFARIEDFWAAPLDLSGVAVLNVNIETYRTRSVPRPAPSADPYTFLGTLRGEHSLVAIPSDGRIQFSFDRMDVNRYLGEDSVDIELMRGIQRVERKRLYTDTAEPLGTQTARETITFSDLPDGVYHVNIKSTNDTFLRNIESPYHPIIFAEHMMLADGNGYGSWFDGRNNPVTTFEWYGSEMKASTPHVESLQTISVDQVQLPLMVVGAAQRVNLLPGKHTLNIPDRDAELQFDGVLLASDGPLLIPPQRQVRLLHNQTDLSAVDYIVEARIPVKQDAYGRYVEAEFGPGELLSYENGQIHGAFLIPYAPEEQEQLRISRVEWTLHKPPIYLKDLPKRLLSKLGL